MAGRRFVVRTGRAGTVWRLVAANNRALAVSADEFPSPSDCQDALAELARRRLEIQIRRAPARVPGHWQWEAWLGPPSGARPVARGARPHRGQREADRNAEVFTAALGSAPVRIAPTRGARAQTSPGTG